MKKPKVVVAMSGGVDSSVAAFLLKKQGFEVIGVTMIIWPEDETCPVNKQTKDFIVSVNKSCCSPDDVIDARRIASQLKIPFQSLNFIKRFRSEVVDYFCKQYLEGVTPNPCIICNEKLKFGYLLDYSLKKGADYLATGHYARNCFRKKDKTFVIKKGRDNEKDQSYVLFSIDKKKLKNVIFPLGDLNKKEVRSIAEKNGLVVAKKKESQEICFIPDNDYPRFIKEHFPEEKKTGFILDVKGKVLGRHKGIYHYTIGQRKGLGISSQYPLYVIKINTAGNEIIVGRERDLYRQELIAENVNWLVTKDPKKPILIKAKIRYKSPAEKATVIPFGRRKAKIKFLKPQKAVTPGQAIVFYERDMVVGGGWISKKS